MTRDEAARAGLTRYSTGKPCRAGHIAQRYTSTGNCIACQSAHRKSIIQVRNAAAQGWPRVETNVPHEHLPLLRTVVDLLRRHGERGEEMRAMLRQAVEGIVEHDNTPLSECLIVSGGFEREPVAPIAPGPDPDDGMPGWHGDTDRGAAPASGPLVTPALPGSVASLIPAAFRGVQS